MAHARGGGHRVTAAAVAHRALVGIHAVGATVNTASTVKCAATEARDRVHRQCDVRVMAPYRGLPLRATTIASEQCVDLVDELLPLGIALH